MRHIPLTLARGLAAWRAWYEQQNVDEFFAKVFQIANIDTAVMTNNPFSAAEAACWEQDLPCPDCLQAALRVDEMFWDWSAASKTMREAGYATGDAPTGASAEAARKFLIDWARRMKPVYMAASLPCDFAYPVEGDPPAAGEVPRSPVRVGAHCQNSTSRQARRSSAIGSSTTRLCSSSHIVARRVVS